MSEPTNPTDGLHELDGSPSGAAPHGELDAHATAAGPARVDAAHGDAPHGDSGHDAALGPVDWAAWGAGVLGIAAGLVVAACLYLSTTI